MLLLATREVRVDSSFELLWVRGVHMSTQVPVRDGALIITDNLGMSPFV